MEETPTKLFLETSLPTSASPYPSPSSAFYPPPIPASHEFANKLGATLAGNKRYRGSGGASSTGGRSASPVNGNTLSPSSQNSSRRGSASAPSPLATHQPLVNPLDGIPPSTETLTTDSTPSHDRITDPPCNNPDSLDTITDPSVTNTTPSKTPIASSATTAASSSKRTSQIIESLTPIRAAPPSPAPSRRGSLIRRGSSRRWSRGSGALSTNNASGPDSVVVVPNAVLPGGIGGMAGIGSVWLGAGGGGDSNTGGGTSSTVSEDGSLHSSSGEPTSSIQPNNAAAAAAAASKRASRRLSAFHALASTAEGEVISFSDGAVTSKEAETKMETPTETKMETPTETEPATPADTTETMTEMITTPAEPGTTALKPILVADFAFSADDPRHTKRPFELLTRFERDALSPEERAEYGRKKGDDDDEWEENAEEEEEDRWGWVGVSGLRPRRRVREEEEYGEEEEMTPRFGYGYSYSSLQSEDSSTPTGPNLSNPGRAGEVGGGEGDGGFDPDSPLPPGVYRALYAFEAEGTAEMSLDEGQLVRVVGRGGGVGWAVVERGWKPENSGGGALDGVGVDGGEKNLSPDVGTEESSGALGLAGQALVPEGYLEIWMLDGEDWGGRDVDDF